MSLPELTSPPADPSPPRSRQKGSGKARTVSRLVLVFVTLSAGFLALFLAGVVDFAGDRWPVKTFRDRDHSRVRLAPVDTTVAALNRFPRPPDDAFRGRSRIAEQELTVYRVRATLGRVSHELDGDIHIVLIDPEHPAFTMIAEIPHPLFSLGSGLEKVFRAERVLMRDHRNHRGGAVEVTGVGFFDYRTHLLQGGAANGFELHPVIGLKFLPAD